MFLHGPPHVINDFAVFIFIISMSTKRCILEVTLVHLIRRPHMLPDWHIASLHSPHALLGIFEIKAMINIQNKTQLLCITLYLMDVASGIQAGRRSQNLLNGLVCCQVISLEMELLPRLHDLLPFDSIYLALFLRHGYRYRKYHPCHILDISELYFTGPIGGRNHYFSGTKMTENKITDVCKKNWKDGKSKYCPQRQLSLESV